MPSTMYMSSTDLHAYAPLITPDEQFCTFIAPDQLTSLTSFPWVLELAVCAFLVLTDDKKYASLIIFHSGLERKFKTSIL